VTEVRIRSPFLAQLYREAYARHVEGLRLGLQESTRPTSFPPRRKKVPKANVAREPVGGKDLVVDRSGNRTLAEHWRNGNEKISNRK
jgi:hypothetical protein